MNTASMTLKKIDLLNFISQSDAPGAVLRMTTTNDGKNAGIISFPSCGNWVNRPLALSTRRQALALIRKLVAR
jgi:hypothetical protein